MPNEQLSAYIRECLSKGSQPAELLATLTGAGWNSDDVKAALFQISGYGAAPAPVAPPVVVTAPVVAQVAQVLPVQPSTASFEAAPLQAAMPQVTPAALPIVSASAPAPLPLGMEFAPQKNSAMGKMIAGVMGVAVFVVAAGTAAGYFILFRNSAPLPEVEVALMQDAMKSVHAYAFDTRVTLDMTAQTNSPMLTQNSQPTEGKMKFAVTATGTVNIGETASTSQMDISYSVDGNASYAAVSVILDGAMDIRSVDGKLYLRIVKIPQALAMLGVTDQVAPWQNKWIVIDQSGVASIDPGLSASFSALPSSTTTQEYRDKAAEILKKDWPLIMTAPKEDAVKVAGVEVYHYQFTIDANKLSKLIKDLAALYPENYGGADPAAVSESSDIVTSLVASTTGDIYIGKKDSYLYRTDVRVPINFATSSVSVAGNFDIIVIASQFNAIAPIIPPLSATPAADVYKSIMGSSSQEIPAPSKSRDAHRTSDLGQIELALEFYYEAHQKFPTTLSLLVKEKYIPELPVDPLDKKPYYYQQLKSGKTYALGASLEETDGRGLDENRQFEKKTILETDADQKISGFKTADDKGCNGEVGRHCYDFSPY